MKRLHAIFIGEIVVTINEEWDPEINPSEERFSEFFKNGEFASLIAMKVKSSQSMNCEVYQKAAQIAFEEIGTNGKV